MLKSSVCGRVTKHLSSFFIFITTLSIVILSQVSSTSAVDSSATATVHVSEACSLTANVTEEHSDEMSNGTYTNSLGETKFTARCNDNAGFAIYAIGYSDDTYGATSMLGENGLSIPTGTDALNGNTNSHWSMKISKDTTSYQPANLTIENNFDSQHVIPSIYTKIASYSASTDGINGTGSSIFTTYGVRISGTQPANTYIGKVKYTLVHPNMVDNSNKPVAPIPSNLLTVNYIIYAPNDGDVEGDMSSLGYTEALHAASPKAGRKSASSSTVNLIAPNFKREGYGFAGWSTDFEATSSSIIYGPNETISTNSQDARGLDVSGGAVLYPVWIAKEANVTMQTFNSNYYASYTSAPNGTVIALEDERDHDVYAVAKLADGQWWMIENLRLDDTAIITTTNTNNPLHDINNTVTLNANGTLSAHLAATSNSWCDNNDVTCIDQTMLNTNNTRISDSGLTASYYGNNTTSKWYSYGNYYNWYSATAGNGVYNKTSGTADGDLCPTGWHLPYGSSDTGGNAVGGFSYLMSQLSDDNTTSRKLVRSFPNNFVYSGYWKGAQANSRSSTGNYWSSSARSTGSNFYAYSLYVSNIYVSNLDYSKYYGYSVRCVKSLPTIDDVESLQDFNSFSSQEMTSVLNSMTTGQTYHIPDNRDNESYTIAKLADGNVWMLDNLKLDLSNSSVKANLNSDTTNAENSSLTSLASNVTDGTINSYTTPQIVTAYKNTTNGTPYGSGSGKAGIYYNYCAASAGTICDNSSTSDATSDICPAGWRLPTGGSDGEFQDLCLAYDSNCSSGSSSLTASNTASVQYNLSQANAGWARNSSLYMENYGVFLWSSTYSGYNTGSIMYDMYLTDTGANSVQSFATRDYGISMRCIVNK